MPPRKRPALEADVLQAPVRDGLLTIVTGGDHISSCLWWKWDGNLSPTGFAADLGQKTKASSWQNGSSRVRFPQTTTWPRSLRQNQRSAKTDLQLLALAWLQSAPWASMTGVLQSPEDCGGATKDRQCDTPPFLLFVLVFSELSSFWVKGGVPRSHVRFWRWNDCVNFPSNNCSACSLSVARGEHAPKTDRLRSARYTTGRVASSRIPTRSTLGRWTLRNVS